MSTDVAVRSRPSRTVAVVAATALAWAGFVIHNLADLPGQTATSPELLYPTLVTLTCLAVFLLPATRVVGVWLLAIWTTLHLVGGALSVLPLPFLPFEPEQSVSHYAFHGLYALTQIPLLWACVSWLRHPRRGGWHG